MASNHIKIRLASVNARGCNSIKKKAALSQWMSDNQFTILNIQETHLMETKLKNFDEKFDGTNIHNPSNSNHSRGVSTVIRKNALFDIESQHITQDGRVLLFNIKYNDFQLSIVNIYAPTENTKKKQFFSETIQFIRKKSTQIDNMLVTGDFNISIDRGNNADKEIFKNFLVQLRLFDNYKHKNKQDLGITYFSSRFQSRIDYILATKSLSDKITKNKIRVAPVPDHRALEVTIKIATTTRGPSYWKLNADLLNNDNFCKDIENIIEETPQKYRDKPLTKGQVWDLIKIKIKECGIKYGIERSKNRNELIENLEKQILNIDNNNGDHNERVTLQENLQQLLAEKNMGAQIRSKAKYVEEGEKSTPYFLNLEKARQQKNVINELTTEYGTTINKKDDILENIENFYKELYTTKMKTTKNTQPDTFDNLIENKLSESQKELCEGRITIPECELALKKMKLKKSPGSDGLTVEFYLTFWDQIKSYLVDVYNEAHNREELPHSLNTAIISLLYKKGDRKDLKNYRPISLTNIDYKILTHVISNRLHMVLNKIINENQKAYVKKRYIGHNIRLIEDVIEIAKTKKIDLLLAFIDFQKAFDSIEWSFVEKTLKDFNFGNNICQWFRTIYKKPTILVKNNGWFTNHIIPTRGLKQGCPLSALLFIIALEPLCKKIEKNQNIKGVNIKNLLNEVEDDTELKTIQYADDIALIIQDKESLTTAINHFKDFEKVAGLKINKKKSEILPFGKFRNLQEIEDIQTKDIVRYLGITVGHDKDECTMHNWTEKIAKLNNTLEQWKKRNLTILGKITIIKTLALSKIVYSVMNTSMPSDTINKINKSIYDFIWYSKERIKRNTLIGEIKDGGVNMVNIEHHFLALKASWVNKIITSNETWSFQGNKLIKDFGPNHLLLYTNNTNNEYINKIPEFYQQVIKSHVKINNMTSNDPKTINDILNSPIWQNVFITTKQGKVNKPLYFKNWIASGIIFIKDLKIKDSKVDENYCFKSVKKKHNIFAEIMSVKRALSKYLDRIKTLPHPNEYTNETVTLPKITTNTTQSNTKLMNKTIFIPPKFSLIKAYKPEILMTEVQEILVNKIKKEKDKKIAEFNYKWLTDNLISAKILSKWKENVPEKCLVCDEVDDTDHMLFRCTLAKKIWEKSEESLGITFLPKKFITQQYSHMVNTILSYIAFYIYKFWIETTNNRNNKSQDNITYYIKKNMLCLSKIEKERHNNLSSDMAKGIYNIL